MQTWYNLKAAADKTPVLSIFDDIGAYGVSAKSFLNDLRTVTTDEGGCGNKARLAAMCLRAWPSTTACAPRVKRSTSKCWALRRVASLVAMAGDTIEMPENAFMMIHNPWGFAMGGADEMRNTADVLDKIGTGLVSTYAKRTGKTDPEITALLDAETWMTAQEAVDAGFATSVTAALLKALLGPCQKTCAWRSRRKRPRSSPRQLRAASNR